MINLLLFTVELVGNLRLTTTVGRAGEVYRSCRWWIGSSTNRLGRKKEIKIVNKQDATDESLIDGHPVKNVIS